MSQAERYFFIHIMKTGGATFRRQIEGNFAPGEVYPDDTLDGDLLEANLDVAYLLGLPPERTNVIRVYTGHFPYFVAELVSPALATLTIIRDPVERTISHLKQWRKRRYPDLTLEQAYEGEWANEILMRNFQVKQFAMTAHDHPNSALNPIELDEDRMALARENLAQVDVIGLQERYEEFMVAVHARFGWESRPIGNWHVSEPTDVSAALIARISEDNAWDLDFYDYAVQLHHDRRNG